MSILTLEDSLAHVRTWVAGWRPAAIHVRYEHAEHTLDAQYLVAMGFQVPCQITMGLPAFVYLVELRSTKSVHPTLREVVHRMIKAFQKSHPEVLLHVDMTPDPWNVRRGTQTIERKS